ncbi:MAG: biotin synthase BioB [Candidatus Saganbacteria bacterium]|nr:biotin synthase BioB [Candidatus Saganbacteria bacterium]
MKLPQLLEKCLKDKNISFKEALSLINTKDADTFDLLAAANKIRQKFKGNKIILCSIVNAKSGKCTEDCSFCAQSRFHKTNVETYPLLNKEELLSFATQAQKSGGTCFSIVTSGKGVVGEKELETITNTIRSLRSRKNLRRCASLGILSKEALAQLKAAGLKRFHHNLETARSFFPKMCTTHTYDERIATIKAAKEVGLEVCSGGIFGLGESPKQRVELAFELKKLGVKSVPINILTPVKGTKAAKGYKPMKPLEILRLIATYRFIMPEVDLGVFGGRELNLRSLQPLMYIAGANQTLLGNYLTTCGRDPKEDVQMIKDLRLTC